MSAVRNTDTEWVSIRSSETCPICGSRKGRCGMLVEKSTGNVVLYRCKENTAGKPDGRGWYIHRVSDFNTGSKEKIIPTTINISDYKPREFKEEDLKLWNEVYNTMRNLMFKFNGYYLYSNHMKNLLDRGFSEKEIEHLKFFSIPKNDKIQYNGFQCSLKTAIINELKKKFKDEDLLNVPGFSLISAKSKSFVTFNNTMYNKEKNAYEYLDGYFIPYFNENGLLVGMQYRLTVPRIDDKGKPMRYLWYSSKNVTCGSPIDYYVPSDIAIEDVILVSEGGIKTKYAATKLRVRSLAEAGVGNYRHLIKVLQNVEKIEGKKFRVLLALDMDKYSNSDVLSAEIKTVALLKSCGYEVTILEWNDAEGKGIDDKILKTGFKDFRYLSL